MSTSTSIPGQELFEVEAITNRKAPSGISRKPTATTSMACCFFCRLVMIAQEHLGFGVCVMPNEIVGLGATLLLQAIDVRSPSIGESRLIFLDVLETLRATQVRGI
jgi:hypothetical protein